MRRGYNCDFIGQDGVLNGVSLGADFTSEHEWGIAKLKGYFGIGTDIRQLGVEKRKVTQVKTEWLKFQEVTYEKKKRYVLIFVPYADFNNPLTGRDLNNYEIEPSYGSKVDMGAAWDEGSFGISVGKEDRDKLQEIYDAFLKKDIIIMVGASGPFKNGGLNILIASRLPEDFKQKLYDVDVDSINLKKAAEKTGIIKKLDKAGKKYYALSPRWKDDEKKEVIFWLNPSDQQNNNYGWFGVEELEDWIKDKGPIPMKNNKKK